MQRRLPRRTLAIAAAVATAASVAVGIGTGTVASAAAGCSARYTVTGQWPGGFQGAVDVQNLGSAVTTWTVTWPFASGEAIAQGWGGTFSQSGTKVSVSAAAWNGSVATNGRVTIGFIGSGTPASNPTSFTLNGVTCTGSTSTPPTTRPTTTPTTTPTTRPTTTPTSSTKSPTAVPTTKIPVTTAVPSSQPPSGSTWPKAQGSTSVSGTITVTAASTAVCGATAASATVARARAKRRCSNCPTAPPSAM